MERAIATVRDATEGTVSTWTLLQSTSTILAGLGGSLFDSNKRTVVGYNRWQYLEFVALLTRNHFDDGVVIKLQCGCRPQR